MRLLPAIKLHDGTIITGAPDDSHNTLIEAKKLEGIEDNQRGFSPGGKLWLTRKTALQWLKQYEPKVYAKVRLMVDEHGLHSEHYAQAKGIEQKTEKIDLSTKKAIVYDRGLYVYLAQKLGESFGKVWYAMPDSSPYPESIRAQIGTGLPEIERIEEFEDYIDKADVVIFFDCYDGAKQHWLRKLGYNVFGDGKSEKVELKKDYFLEVLADVGLPVPKTYRAEGLDDLCQYLDGKGEKWLKTIARGDFETKKYPGNMPEFQQWINDLRAKIGARRAKTIEVLVQNPIKSACEAGWDGFQVNGSYIKNGMVGYEIKDNGLVGKIMEEPPGVLKAVNDKMSPILRELGGMGHFSTEVRITEAGTGYFIDPTMRAPSPPSELMCEIYENYAEAVYQIACGKLPIMKPRAKFGAEIIMKSPAYEKSELYVSFPKELYPFVKLKDQMKDGGDYICLPNGNGSFFGAVIAMANTRKEAEKKAMEYIEQVKADEFEYDKDLFAEEEATIAKGKKFGIDFS